MRTYDFSPLYRSTIGFDRLFDMLDQTARGESPPNWPPSPSCRALAAAESGSSGTISLISRWTL